MDVIAEKEQQYLISKSKIIDKYNKSIDRESAYELLNAKLNELDEAKKDKRM